MVRGGEGPMEETEHEDQRVQRSPSEDLETNPTQDGCPECPCGVQGGHDVPLGRPRPDLKAMLAPSDQMDRGSFPVAGDLGLPSPSAEGPV